MENRILHPFPLASRARPRRHGRVSRVSASFPSVDLSQLAAPDLVARLSFDECFAAIRADFQARNPEFSALLPSDPAIKVMEACAYREQLLRAAISDAGLGTMLAFARGAALDQLAAFYGLHRLIIVHETDDAPAVLETDDELRARVQLAPELLAGPGLTGGGYRAAALTIAPELKDVGLVKRAGGHVDIILLGRDGDGTVPAAIVARVRDAFSSEDAVQLTDIVAVRSATILPYAAAVTVQIRSGPDPELIRVAAEARVRAYAAERHRIGLPVYAQRIEAAASVGAAERALVDIGDVVPGAAEAAYLTALTVAVEVVA